MTRQEQIIEAWCKYRGKCSTEILNALAFSLRWCDAHPNWISVEDELPPIGWTMSDCVLVTDGKVMKIAWYHQDEGWLFATGFKFEPTHWMPLPAPPAKFSSLERNGKEANNE